MAAGKPKRFSAAEIARRAARIQKYNAERKKVAAVGAKRSCPKRKKSNGELNGTGEGRMQE